MLNALMSNVRHRKLLCKMEVTMQGCFLSSNSIQVYTACKSFEVEKFHGFRRLIDNPKTFPVKPFSF